MKTNKVSVLYKYPTDNAV